MAMSYYAKQRLQSAQMMQDLANRKPTICEDCKVPSMYCSTQLTSGTAKEFGYHEKPRCSDCWKAFWKMHDAKKAEMTNSERETERQRKENAKWEARRTRWAGHKKT